MKDVLIVFGATYLFAGLVFVFQGCGTVNREIQSVEFHTTVNCDDYELGDVNLDRQVDGYDLSLMLSESFSAASHQCTHVLDVDKDGTFELNEDSLALEAILAVRYM